MSLPSTSLTLLSRLRDEGDARQWQVSWKRFVELYHGSLMAMASGIYRGHTGNATPTQETLQDIVSRVVVEFVRKDRYDANRGRFRTYLRTLVNARVVDTLRKDRPLDHIPLGSGTDREPSYLPEETAEEREAFKQSVLATLIEDLRETIPLRQFEIFEMVKLQGRSPDEVAEELGVKRGVVDNTIYKVMTRLREIATRPEYKEEYFG